MAVAPVNARPRQEGFLLAGFGSIGGAQGMAQHY